MRRALASSSGRDEGGVCSVLPVCQGVVRLQSQHHAGVDRSSMSSMVSENITPGFDRLADTCGHLCLCQWHGAPPRVLTGSSPGQRYKLARGTMLARQRLGLWSASTTVGGTTKRRYVPSHHGTPMLQIVCEYNSGPRLMAFAINACASIDGDDAIICVRLACQYYII